MVKKQPPKKHSGPQTHRGKVRKGNALQELVCRKISELLHVPWGKDELIESRGSSQPGVDIRLLGHVRELFPFSIECKNHETWSIKEYIDQAKANKLENTFWMLVLKRAASKKASRIDPIVVMDLEEFFTFLRTFVYRGL